MFLMLGHGVQTQNTHEFAPAAHCFTAFRHQKHIKLLWARGIAITNV